MPVQCAAMAVPWPGSSVGLRAWEQILFLLHRCSDSAWEQILFLLPRCSYVPWRAMPVPGTAMAGLWP